jgi:signal transduction histidine kinase
MIPKIFDMFSQIETPEKQERGGLGIGLNVVKKLVEMHSGTVEAFSGGLGKEASLSCICRLTPSNRNPRLSIKHRKRIIGKQQSSNTEFW